MQRSLHLSVPSGAVVQDVSNGSPAERAGLRVYDVIVGFEGAGVGGDDELIHAIAARAPGSAVQLRVLRDGREMATTVRLSERPSRDAADVKPTPAVSPVPINDAGGLLGLTVRDLDATAFNRLHLPKETRGVLIARVDPLSAAVDADVQRGTVLLEINRKPVLSTTDYTRITSAIRPGDVLTLYVYVPDVAQRQLKTVRIDDR